MPRRTDSEPEITEVEEDTQPVQELFPDLEPIPPEPEAQPSPSPDEFIGVVPRTD